MDSWLKLDFSNWIQLLEWEGARTHPTQPPWEQRPKGWWGLAAGLALSRSLRFWLVHIPQRWAAPGSLWEPGELLGGAFWSPYQKDPKSYGFFCRIKYDLVILGKLFIFSELDFLFFQMETKIHI